MGQYFIQRILPHLAGIGILLVLIAAFYAPAFQGKVLQQSDNVQAYGMQNEIRDFKEKTGRHVHWTNAAFAGMPVYQILPENSKTVWYRFVYKVWLLGGDVTTAYGSAFALAIGMYLLLALLGVDWRIATVGAFAFSFSTGNIHLIEAGHSTKLFTLSFVPTALAGFLLMFRGKYLAGFAVAAAFMGFQIHASHYQITYYFGFILMFLFGAFAIHWFKNGKAKHAAIVAGLSIAAVGLGVLPSLSRMYTTYTYSPETIRGQSTLQSKNQQDGLDKDYIFDWSYGIPETMTLLVPNFYGGTSMESFLSDQSSSTLAAYRRVAPSLKPEQQQALQRSASHYWGNQPFTSGPVYIGAVIMLAFFMGCWLVKGPIKWGLIASTVLLLMFSWGSNLSFFNYLMVDYFPMFNKFRAVTMALSLAQMTIILLAVLGLQEFFFNSKTTEDDKKMSILVGLGAAAGLCILGLLASFMMKFGTDATMPVEFASALKSERAGLLRADVLRSLVFILLSGGALFAAWKYKLSAWVSIPLFALLVIGDLWMVDSRFLNSDRYIAASQKQTLVQPTDADKRILADTDPHFRVLDLTNRMNPNSPSGNPFSNALTSYFHKSIGGYHAAKLMRYQELVDAYMVTEGRFTLFENQNVLDMLNTKYFIQNQGQGPVPIVRNSANGNAWFVNQIKTAATADEELALLKGLNTKQAAVIHSEFSEYLSGFTPSTDPSASIRLTGYEPDKLTYTTNSSREQLAVFSEVYYTPSRGWTVTIDGQEIDGGFIRANHVLRALRVPAGQHTIVFEFKPSFFDTSQMLELIGSLLILLILLTAIGLSLKKRFDNPNNYIEQKAAPVKKQATKSTRPSSNKKKKK